MRRPLWFGVAQERTPFNVDSLQTGYQDLGGEDPHTHMGASQNFGKFPECHQPLLRVPDGDA